MTGKDVQEAIRFTFLSAGKQWIKYSAVAQRDAFGFAVFGKKDIRGCEIGIMSKIKVAYGMDYDIRVWTWDQIAHAINTHTVLEHR